MNKWKKYIKREMDVEFLACVHAMSLIAVYGFELYICNVKSVPYAVIFQLFVLGYIISWFQKLLFIEEKIYTKRQNILKSVLWCVGPNVITWFGSLLCRNVFKVKWFTDLPDWVEIVFYITMLSYYVMVWIAIKLMYNDETKKLNEILIDYKNNN